MTHIINRKFQYEYTFRVCYSDTDQMGFMHHSCYFKHYESARWEMFRSLGCPYEEIESEGIILPVINSTISFLKPARFAEVITIKTELSNYRAARMIFANRMMNQQGEIVNHAQISLACVSKQNTTACLPYGKLQQLLENFQILNIKKV